MDAVSNRKLGVLGWPGEVPMFLKNSHYKQRCGTCFSCHILLAEVLKAVSAIFRLVSSSPNGREIQQTYMTATTSLPQFSQDCLQWWEIFLINVGSVDETKGFCVYLSFLKILQCADGIAVTQREDFLCLA